MGMLDDVLSWMDNKRRVAGRNVSDLWNDPKNALSKTGYQTAIELADTNNYGPGAMKGMLGATAWHGSPHKFDKFSLDKIGTGEGAQAYGHGLYLAESPVVAKSYADELAQIEISHNGKPLGVFDESAAANAAHNIRAAGGDIEKAKKRASIVYTGKWRDDVVKEIDNLGAGQVTEAANGQLYKTDIPDEAVARFLDWDKPLSQQAPEVQAAIGSDGNFAAYVQKIMEKPITELDGKTLQRMRIGYEADLGTSNAAGGASDWLNKQGIPGIRYLDGGSRSAGQGSSNFVAFDPEMIRILERNGQATGLNPWQPGEYNMLRDTTAEPPLFPDTTR